MEDTEWNDILRAKGIIPEITTEKLDEIIDQVLEQQQIKPKSEEELEELMDDFEYHKFRQQRIQELKDMQAQEKFAKITEISKSDWKTEVTDASAENWIICCLYQSNYDSQILLKILEKLADKYPTVKFIKIKADLCIENYPDRNTPTLLCYYEQDMKKQLIGLKRIFHSLIFIKPTERVAVLNQSKVSLDWLALFQLLAQIGTKKKKATKNSSIRLICRPVINRIGKRDKYRGDEDSDDE